MKLTWHGIKPEGAEEIVMSDMRASNLMDMDPNDLLFHTVWLTDDMEGPAVLVWGEDGGFHAKYSCESELVQLAE